MFEEEVAAGAKLLDERLGPEWPLQLDFQKLDLASCETCVLGQLMGTYRDGLLFLEIQAGGPYGFNIPNDFRLNTLLGEFAALFDEQGMSAYASLFLDLEEAWLALVKNRLNAGGATQWLIQQGRSPRERCFESLTTTSAMAK